MQEAWKPGRVPLFKKRRFVMPAKILAALTDVILDETQPTEELHLALNDFARLCSEVTGIIPDRSFDSWANDSFLPSGLAINPNAAAYCIKDYQRSIVFLRGIYAAVKIIHSHSNNTSVRILYAGCGPFATLLLPLLPLFEPGDLDIHLLDIHPDSLDCVRELLTHFGLNGHTINLIQGDASSYQHPQPLHLIIAETMQKSLEQEPQFAVTANLAPQLYRNGVFIPQNIEVLLCLAHWEREKSTFNQLNTPDHKQLIDTAQRHELGTLINLIPEQAAQQLQKASYNSITAKFELEAVQVIIPKVNHLDEFDALMLTRIQVFNQYQLHDYEAEITLPHKCYEMTPITAGAIYQVRYQLGNYPHFQISVAPGSDVASA